ncbi:hypothetical protein PPERSA_12902 [Pseudocohnilembus persalinus]|uniref:Uncharacterized protein n=1 Tax=Pseudocohnilembus persalinus TaxID=266149 RepID=A0A0V0R2K5_PSEPJ|nr:hypothetical protein PPERSA_12902 [Pseudocohnilembus persalinus]|eukprot:KRX08421.1 hypothetical protein PPERSA_12902 [Pseudocohnilembus persalinus]
MSNEEKIDDSKYKNSQKQDQVENFEQLTENNTNGVINIDQIKATKELPINYQAYRKQKQQYQKQNHAIFSKSIRCSQLMSFQQQIEEKNQQPQKKYKGSNYMKPSNQQIRYYHTELIQQAKNNYLETSAFQLNSIHNDWFNQDEVLIKQEILNSKDIHVIEASSFYIQFMRNLSDEQVQKLSLDFKKKSYELSVYHNLFSKMYNFQNDVTLQNYKMCKQMRQIESISGNKTNQLKINQNITNYKTAQKNTLNSDQEKNKNINGNQCFVTKDQFKNKIGSGIKLAFEIIQLSNKNNKKICITLPSFLKSVLQAIFSYTIVFDLDVLEIRKYWDTYSGNLQFCLLVFMTLNIPYALYHTWVFYEGFYIYRQDLSRKLFLLNQMTHIITSKKLNLGIGKPLGKKKFFPTINLLCPLSIKVKNNPKWFVMGAKI